MRGGKAERWLRRGSLAAGVGCAAAVLCANPRTVLAERANTSQLTRTHPQKRFDSQLALTPWEQAERAREELEALPEPARTHAQFTRVLDAYRDIYHRRPGDLHAAAAVFAVAELLAEQGRLLHDAGSLKAALTQYEFLRKQYPGSGLRVEALLAEAQIDENDLADPAAARDRYALLLHLHPHSAQAEEARAGLDSLDRPAQPAAPAASRDQTATSTYAQTPGDPHTPGVPQPGAPFIPQPHRGMSGIARTPTPTDTSQQTPTPDQPRPDPLTVLARLDAETRPAADPTGPTRIGKKALVTGIRHWSTTSYTRVAIDLGDSVTYEAARVPNPDRIYFDLHNTRLAQDLVGKSFSVTDDGFLKRIRAAQFSDDMTRVVLDVSDVTEYSAFLLPNPYRLIIDIHGRPPGPPVATAHPATTLDAAEVPAPHTAGLVRSTPTRPVPNTLASHDPSSAEVAAVSAQPGNVRATSHPTSSPISAVVPQAEAPARADASTTPRDLAFASTAPELPIVTAQGTPIALAPASAPVPSGRHSRHTRAAATTAAPAQAAAPTANGETSLVRALGLKIGRIVIDAGHGGHDSGTLGVDGLEEKDVVLDVALRVGKLLHDRLGAEIIYTRSDDTFIPLETRTAIANKAQADLFLSIHANSSSDSTARGVETYYLNFTSDPSALETAARENAVSDQSIHQLSDLVKKIALKEKIEESREFAADVQGSLYSGLAHGNGPATGADAFKNRGIKKAPFVVLIGANMPSILAEISFVTNPRDAEELRNPEYRERVAESLYRGVARYEAGLASPTRTPLERAAAGQ